MPPHLEAGGGLGAGRDEARELLDLVVVGAGQAGLAISRELARLGLEHVVLERGRVGETWRGRWESFCLVTPNWSMQLPDQPYDGTDPDGFDHRDEIVGFLERYASTFDVPVREGITVHSLRPRAEGGFLLDTSSGLLAARAVVLATGAYQRPMRLASATSLPPDLLQLDVEGYVSPEALPDGAVLVVGSGQSGCQIAEELAEAGRDVFVSCGRAPWMPRRIGDHDLFWWLEESGFLDATVDSLPDPGARLWANVLATGHGGGHDLHLRTLHEMGVVLLGHFDGADGMRARFKPDLAESLAWGDERYAQLLDLFTALAERSGIRTPDLPEPSPFEVRSPEALDLTGFGAVLFTTGFRPDYASWVLVPDAFDEVGYPIHEDGESRAAPGLFFVGVHFLRKRKSALLIGVGEDAAIVASRVAESRAAVA